MKVILEIISAACLIGIGYLTGSCQTMVADSSISLQDLAAGTAMLNHVWPWYHHVPAFIWLAAIIGLLINFNITRFAISRIEPTKPRAVRLSDGQTK